MQKKTIALVAALAACGLAQAQTAPPPSVTLYGLIDVYLESLQIDGRNNGKRDARMSNNGLAGTRWGMRGSEDLGGGLKANFVLESGFALTNGTLNSGQAFSREAYVGLSSATLGELRLGRQYAPIHYALIFTDVDFGSAAGPVLALWASNLDQTRQNNQVGYWTPKFGAFSALFTVNEGGEARPAGQTSLRNYGAMVQYQTPTTQASVALHRGGSDGGAPGKRTQTALHAGVKHDFGGFTLAGAYYRHENDLPATSASPKTQAVVLGGYVPVGQWGFVAQLGHVWDDGKIYNTGASKAKGKDNYFNVGANYNFSKRTLAYARYGQVSDDNGGFNARAGVPANGYFGALGSGFTAGGGASTLQLGVLHRF